MVNNGQETNENAQGTNGKDRFKKMRVKESTKVLTNSQKITKIACECCTNANAYFIEYLP